MPDLLDGIPVTPQSIAHLPDAPRDPEDAIGIGPLSAHVAVLSRKGKATAGVVAAADRHRKEQPAERTVARQAEAAKNLLAHLRSIGADEDAELVADTIEGETNLLEAVDAAVAEIDECDILIEGLRKKEAEFETRRKMIENRAERIRAAIEQAMLVTEQVSMKLPSATLSLAKRKRALVIVNEADIPSRFWVEQERPAPKLDKKALAEALVAADIPGAALDNGSFSLTVRRR